MSPVDYCQDKAAPYGSSLHYSLLTLPSQQRQGLTTLHAFQREIVQISDECHETRIARAKLNWWREELDRLFAGRPQHPVSQALAAYLNEFKLPHPYFRDIIDGVEMDLDYDTYPSFKELSLYCRRVGSVFSLLAVKILDYEDQRTVHFAHELGMVLQLVHILHNVRNAALKGRLYIPEDEMERFRVRHTDLLQSQSSESVRALFKFQAERARAYHRRALQYLSERDRYAQRSHLILAELAMNWLDEVEADGYRILEHRIILTPLRKLWTAWRVNRCERRRHRQHSAIT